MATSPTYRKPARTVAAWLLLCCAAAAAQGENAANTASGAPPSPSGASSVSAPSGTVVVPAASASPLKRNFRYYAKSTWAHRNFAEAAFLAGIPKLNGAPEQPQPPLVIDEQSLVAYSDAMQQYSSDMDDWRRSSEEELRYRARRFGFGLATAETRDLLSDLVLPTALRQDPRYVPADLDLAFNRRMAHAAASIFVTKNNAGAAVPNYSKWLGAAGAALIARHLYADRLGVPQLNSNQFVWRYIGYSLAGDLATNVANEAVRASLRRDIENMQSEGVVTSDHYYPLTGAGTVLYWARSMYAPRHFLAGGLFAGIPNVASQPVYPVEPPIHNKAEALAYGQKVVQYGNDMESWRQNTDEEIRYRGRRFIAGFSESETQSFLGNLLLPLSFRMDPRFLPTGQTAGPGAKFANAFKQLAIGRRYDGSQTLNVPLLGGTVGAALVAQHLYYDTLGVPELAGNRVLAKTISLNLMGDLLLNVIHEFSPRHNY